MLRHPHPRKSQTRQHNLSQISARPLTFESLLPVKSQTKQPRNSSPRSIVIKPIESVFRRQPANKGNTSCTSDLTTRLSQLKRPQTVRGFTQDNQTSFCLRKGLFQIELEKNNKENIPNNVVWDDVEVRNPRQEKRKQKSMNIQQPPQIIIINKKAPVRIREPTEESLLLSLSAEDFVRISEPSGAKEVLDMSPYFQ